ncbi:MAG: inner membrane-spanning protein YciB [Pseudomonadota bacterium]
MKFLFELFPALVFFAVFTFTGKDIITATAALMAACAVQVVLGRAAFGRFDRMHLAVFGVVLVFGGLTLALHDEQFIKWKPTIVDLIIAAVLLGSEFVGARNLLRIGAEAAVERIGEGARIEAPAATWRWINAAAIVFFVGCALLNLWVIEHYDTATWVNIKTFGYPLLNIVFMVALIAWLWRHVIEPETAAENPADATPPDSTPRT